MVRISNAQVWAIRDGLTKAEKDLINFYELQWFLRKHVPTIEEVYQQLKKSHPKIKYVSINYYLQRPPVIKALKQRGINYQQHTQEDLTPTQVAAAVTVMNFADTRSNDEKLDQLGINPSQYYAWLNDPQFKNLVENLADQNLANIRPEAIGEFTKLIHKGDWNAIKYYLDVTGAIQSDSAPQAEQLLQMFIEVIQKHVKDPVVIVAIAEDLKLATANRTLETVAHPQIMGSVVNYDPELEEAKKKLGVM